MGPIGIKVEVAQLDGMLVMALGSLHPSDPRCWVKDEDLYIEPRKGGDDFPVYLQFEASRPITDVGFLPVGDGGSPQPHQKKGTCGGCFSLECDIDPTSTVTPLIRNDGPGTNPPTAYRFMLWFEDGKKPTGIDPQIYNQGLGDWPWLGRLRRWLQGLRGRRRG